MRRFLFVGWALLVGAGCGSSSAGDEASTARPQIVVTHAVLGAMVDELVDGAADVKVLVPNGTDPHEWEPSAKDIEAVDRADLVVANGLDLESRLVEVLVRAELDGVPVFRATDHVDVRSGGDEHGDGGSDPHFWTDPIEMSNVVDALSARLDEIGIDVDGEALKDEYAKLDGQVGAVLAGISNRVLVTGHESLGYFADRYDFELVGAVIPGMSPEVEATAANLSELKDAMKAAGVDVIFTEAGTPADVTRTIAEETGAGVVELGTHLVPDEGTYRSFILGLASTIADALAS
jgi:zinc/manganese transport system substrate-binding protein